MGVWGVCTFTRRLRWDWAAVWSKNWGGVGGILVPKKGGGNATRWGLRGAVSVGRKWLWKGLRTCTWEREGWVFLSHLSLTTDYLPENSGGIPRRSTFYSGGAWLQRHQPGREFGPFLDWWARTFFIRETRILWWQEGPLLVVQGCQITKSCNQYK